MAGRLTTHVLDTSQGRPAAGMRIELWRVGGSGDGGTESLVTVAITNADGRTDAPMLVDDAFAVGEYELRFSVGDYFAAEPVAVSAPPFLGIVPVRFAIADGDGHYHVPLLASPWAYSTYRGT